MSQSRPDLNTDTGLVIDVFLRTITNIFTLHIVDVYLVGSRVQEYCRSYISVNTAKTPTPKGDIDIYIQISNSLPREQVLDYMYLINGYYRVIHKMYVCSSIGTQVPEFGCKLNYTQEKI